MTANLCCPDCKGDSFALQIEGVQKNAHFAITDDGDIDLTRAETITVTDYDETALRCQSCGEEWAKHELVPAEGTAHDPRHPSERIREDDYGDVTQYDR